MIKFAKLYAHCAIKRWVQCVKASLIFVFILTLAAGCGDGNAAENGNIDELDVVYISERFFVLHTQDIMLNADNYVGRPIRYEGMFFTGVWPPTGEVFYMVVRFADDCCGGGGIIGFEVYLGDIEPFPDDTWVEVTGILERFGNGEEEMLRLDVITLVEMDERGSEVVTLQ